MSHDPNLDASPTPLAPRSVAAWVSVLLLGIGIAATSAAIDRGNRKNLELVVQRTAVEDRQFFPFEDAKRVSLRFQGAPLELASKEPNPMPDTHMIVAGETEAPTYKLYIPVERLNGEPVLGGPSWYLKTGPGQFVRVTR